MRWFCRILCLMFVILLLTVPVYAEELTDELTDGLDPELGLDGEVLERIGPYDSTQTDYPRRLQDMLLYCIRNWNLFGLDEGLKTTGIILSAAMLASLAESGTPFGKYAGTAGSLAILLAVIGNMKSMIGLGTTAIAELHRYLELLLPGMFSLMAISGKSAGAMAIHVCGMTFFPFIISILEKLTVPLLYLYIGLFSAESLLGIGQLSKLREFVKWLLVTGLKWILIGFSAFLTVTGLFSGAADTAKVRMLRQSISGMIPVVGSIVSETSQALLSAAGTIRSSVGTYGMLAVLGICFEPFLRLGVQFFLLKLTAACCGLFGKGEHVLLTDRLTETTGILLGILGVGCVSAVLVLALCVQTVMQ